MPDPGIRPSLKNFGKGLFKKFRLGPEEVTEEEILQIVDIGEEAGAIESAEKELIENIFNFNNRSAEEVMTHRTNVYSIALDDDRDTILALIRETGLSRFPVYGEDMDDIIGTLTARHYLLNCLSDKPLPLRDLVRPAYFVPETLQADVLFRDMQKKKVHMAIVIDEYGGMSGIVTMEDLLEEIVGNIYDEFDPATVTPVEKLEENLWRVSGSATLEEVSEALDTPLTLSDEFDTLGGLVFSVLTSIPEDGSTPEVDADGLHIQVEKMEDHHVVSALVRILPSPDNETSEEE
mgnify:CR=1 FL=1